MSRQEQRHNHKTTKRYLEDEEWLKRQEEEKEWRKQQYEERQLKEYGVVTFSRKSEEYRSEVVVIPIEIEVPTEIDSFTKFEILDEYGRTYKSWIQQCYLHRMKEILTDPTEFGEVVLEEKKRDHCIQNSDLSGPLNPQGGGILQQPEEVEDPEDEGENEEEEGSSDGDQGQDTAGPLT